MKKFFYMAVAAIAALSSCSSDNDPIMGETGKQALIFTASMEGSATSRATLNSNKAEWEANDQISINGKAYKAKTAGAATTFEAVTSGQEATLDEGKYKAYFPASLYSGGTPTLPATQTYTAGKFNMPMYAESTTTDFTFYNLCAVLAVKVTSGTVKKIKVVADQRLHGAFTATAAGVLTFTATGTPTDDERTVTLDCGSGVTANNTTFYIAIPAQTYSYLNIYLSADGDTYKEAMATKKATLGAIARNTMYSINYAKNAVQLWSAGPYFATENVSGKKSQTEGNAAWGDNWELPSQSQWEELANSDAKVTRGWSTTSPYGFTYTGKGDYSAVSLFLPAEGGNADDGHANYWSGSADGADGIYMDLSCMVMGGSFHFDCDPDTDGPSDPYLVRLVLKN